MISIATRSIEQHTLYRRIGTLACLHISVRYNKKNNLAQFHQFQVNFFRVRYVKTGKKSKTLQVFHHLVSFFRKSSPFMNRSSKNKKI